MINLQFIKTPGCGGGVIPAFLLRRAETATRKNTASSAPARERSLISVSLSLFCLNYVYFAVLFFLNYNDLIKNIVQYIAGSERDKAACHADSF